MAGFYQRSLASLQFGSLQGDSKLMSSWGGDNATVTHALKVDPAHKNAAVRRLSDPDPQAGVIDLAGGVGGLLRSPWWRSQRRCWAGRI